MPIVAGRRPRSWQPHGKISEIPDPNLWRGWSELGCTFRAFRKFLEQPPNWDEEYWSLKPNLGFPGRGCTAVVLLSWLRIERFGSRVAGEGVGLKN